MNVKICSTFDDNFMTFFYINFTHSSSRFKNKMMEMAERNFVIEIDQSIRKILQLSCSFKYFAVLRL